MKGREIELAVELRLEENQVKEVGDLVQVSGSSRTQDSLVAVQPFYQQDRSPIGRHLLFGYNVFIGLKTEVRIEAVLSRRSASTSTPTSRTAGWRVGRITRRPAPAREQRERL